MTTNLLEEVRGMMPGHARENWSLEERDQDDIDAASMEKYGVKWRTTPSKHKVGIDDEGKVTKGNPNHPAVGGVSGAKQGKLFGPDVMNRPKAAKGGGGGGEKSEHPKEGHEFKAGGKKWTITKIHPAESGSFSGKPIHTLELKSAKGKKVSGSYQPHTKALHVHDDTEMGPSVTHKTKYESVGRRSMRERLMEARRRFSEQDRLRAVHKQIAEIKDTIHRGPSWSYPDWALPKTEFSEE